MRKVIIIFFVTTLFGCGGDDLQNNSCLKEFKYTGHTWQVPLSISPNKQIYSLGDTVTFSTIYSDSIFDASLDRKFLIRDFPFRPFSLLYRFYDLHPNWEDGYLANEIIVDSTYSPRYSPGSDKSGVLYATTIYQNGMYEFQFKLVLKEKGNYIFFLSDEYESIRRLGLGNGNDEANATQIEGLCDQASWRLITSFQGESYLRDYEKELEFLDKEIYGNELSFLNVETNHATDILQYGELRLEFIGAYAFTVN